MKKTSLTVLLLGTVICTTAQIIRPMTARYSNASVRGNIVYVSNSIIATLGPNTSDVPPSGTGVNNGGTSINIDIDNTTATLLPYGSSWKYSDNNTRYANWETVAYNDGAWATGNAQFGWGQASPSPNVTCLNSGCVSSCPSPPGNCATRTPAYYFRNVVNINPSLYTSIVFNLKRNDGVVIYVNGVEVARDNMPAGAIAHTTYATSAIAGGSAAENYSVTLNTSYFVNGNNTIAVEIHSDKAKATDVSFDLQIQGVNNNGTFNSSSADLNIPACSEVMFAGLYWGAGQGTNGSNTSWIVGETTCKLKLPGSGSFITITSAQTDYHNATLSAGLPHTGYKCFADITSLINTLSPNGSYTIADVVGPSGIVNGYGGWTIVIAYNNPSATPKNLQVFDGNVIVNGGDPAVDVSISGFLTPASGTVACELGAVVFDGDRGSQDAFGFQQQGGAGFYDMATTTIPLNGNADAWNSKISYKGSIVSTRTPAYNNTLGYDAAIFDLPNAGNVNLGNSKTSATVRFSSPGENYFLQVLTTAISQYDPSFQLNKSSTDINGGSLVPGDVLRYSFTYQNVGNDASSQTIVLDSLPFNVGLKPGSIVINGITKTDVAGDDEAEYDAANRRVVFRIGAGANSSSGGSVPVNGSGTLQFDVVVSSSCYILTCGNTISNSARINYYGATSGMSLFDSSYYNGGGGCYIQGPVVNTITGSCTPYGDTTLINICPTTSYTLPWAAYAGYTFYSGIPFTAANVVMPAYVVTTDYVYYAYVNTGLGCTDTIRISAFIQGCPDLDEDDDGTPDYVELANANALGDHDSDGTPNWLDPQYPGFVDNNADGLNDNFDPGADSDGDGIANFLDINFPGFVDSNGDDVDDNQDKDLDGVPDYIDRDSDNDGIPDVVENYGVDANGDGVIDNYTDSDSDGFSNNVDANDAAINQSGNGLGRQDFDGDGIPNYQDNDSDNDGIPDVIEALGTDANNDGKADNFSDADLDGFNDIIDGDADAVTGAENSANALLLTGSDGNGDGLADSYPNKNLDKTGKPNLYDLDSDGDGITDVKEAGFSDVDNNGKADGVLGNDGWSDTIDALATLNLPNSDASGNANYLDIDSDDDGITDNIEGMATMAYQIPLGTDVDDDGIDDRYDNISGNGGAGIVPNDWDIDGIPDYIDTDTDNDAYSDIREGWDVNGNGVYDDNISLTGNDVDGDGLDNIFDCDNNGPNVLSAQMGNGGSTNGPSPSGTFVTVQKSSIAQSDRDWRFIDILPLNKFDLVAEKKEGSVKLSFTVSSVTDIDYFEIYRSTGNGPFELIKKLNQKVLKGNIEIIETSDDISLLIAEKIYYKIKQYSGVIVSFSNTVLINNRKQGETSMQLMPNPVKGSTAAIRLYSNTSEKATIVLQTLTGHLVRSKSCEIKPGNNLIQIDGLDRLIPGFYLLRVLLPGTNYQFKLVKEN
ncbi:MAG TPA: T9SS type A sorting domain-containing protein [Chitinophagaceae bacterium]|nr:T9SS type A sorting domain-containing protein [Chitinophagaceae bacterium]